jgi:hypothetical protein
MPALLTPTGEAAVADLAGRYRVSDGAVRALLEAVVRGDGAMAQFSHPDLGGSGQWMRGGMTMIGDMFNSGLQSTVSGICSELSAQLADGAKLVSLPERPAAGPRPDQAGGFAGLSGFENGWWPAELGQPSSSGGQNDAAYAYFPGPRRLAIRRGQAVTLYDTGDHTITGVQQQQGGRGSVEFTSQFGSFTVDTLPEVDKAADETPARPTKPAAAAPPHAAPPRAAAAREAPARPTEPTVTAPTESAAPPAVQAQTASPAEAPIPAGGASTASEIGAAIETLAGLRDKGLLTAEEFSAKKSELLGRL